MGNCCKKKNVKRASELVLPLNTHREFEDSVGSDKIVVIEIYSEKIPMCRAIEPQLLQLARNYQTVQFFKFHFDDVYDTTEKLEISFLPTFLIFMGGEEVYRIPGRSFNTLRTKIEECLSVAESVGIKKRKISNASDKKVKASFAVNSSTALN